MVVILLLNYQRRALPRLLQNLLQAKLPRMRAARTKGRERGAKRGRMADSGALVSTPQPLPGHLRGTPSENHPGAHARGRENVTAARPQAAHPELAAEKETGTGKVRETILGGSVVVKGGGVDPGVALGPGPGPIPGPGPGHGLEQGPTDEHPVWIGHPPESSRPKGRSVVVAGGLGRVVDLEVRDGGIREALAALKTVCLQRVPPTARAGRIIPIGLQKRVVATLRAGIGTLVVVHAGKTAGTEESHEGGVGVEGLNVAGVLGEVAATVASTASRRKQPKTAGSPETTSQVQATIQGMTRIAASMKTEAVAGGKSRIKETLCLTGQAGHQHPAGLLGGHYPQTFKIITPRGREEDLEAGTDQRRSSQQQRQQVETHLSVAHKPLIARLQLFITTPKHYFNFNYTYMVNNFLQYIFLHVEIGVPVNGLGFFFLH